MARRRTVKAPSAKSRALEALAQARELALGLGAQQDLHRVLLVAALNYAFARVAEIQELTRIRPRAGSGGDAQAVVEANARVQGAGAVIPPNVFGRGDAAP